MTENDKIRSLLIEEIQAVAPKLEKADIEDLLDIAQQPRAEEKLQVILANYKIAKKLNKTTAHKVIRLLNPLEAIIKAITKIF